LILFSNVWIGVGVADKHGYNTRIACVVDRALGLAACERLEHVPWRHIVAVFALDHPWLAHRGEVPDRVPNMTNPEYYRVWDD